MRVDLSRWVVARHRAASILQCPPAVCQSAGQSQTISLSASQVVVKISMNPEDHRKKWDREEYEKRALERLKEIKREEKLGIHKQSAVKKEPLKPRDYKVDLESKIGKTVVIGKSACPSKSGGYYCNLCDIEVKDSINFLDHINSIKHQRHLGMSMKVERSTLEQVRARFAVNKRKLEEKKKEYELEQRVVQLKKQEEKTKEYRRNRKQEKKRKIDKVENDDESEPVDDMAAIMGFSGFGSSKRK